VIRARLRFAEHAYPAPSPIRRWEHFWDYLDSVRARSGGPLVPRPTGANPEVRAFARVDDGRWLVDCPWGCGAAFIAPAGETRMWCTECAGGGYGLTAVLVWPDGMDGLTANLETLPSMLQFWPCIGCRPCLADGRGMCPTCRGMQGLEV
jgi:hypothetical protein